MAILKEAGLDLLGAPAGEVRLDDQRIADSIDRVRQLYQDGVLYQPYQQGPNVQSQDPGELVSQGRVAIWSDVYIAGPDGQPAQPQGIDVGRVPFPADMMDPWSGPGSGGEGFMVSGGTSYPAESWKWIEWLSRQQIGQPGGEPGPIDMPGRIPARQALAEQTGFWEALDEQTAAAYRWALANPAPYSDRQPDYMTLGAISQAVSQVVSDPKVETSKALEDAQKWLDESLAQQSTTPTPEPDTSPVLVATPEPQTAPEGATTITFAVPNYSPSEIRRVVRMFREERPDIFVQIQATQVYTGPLLLQDVARTADCFTWGQVPTDAEMKALLDLQPLIDADAAFPKDDYPPAVLSVYQRGGATYGLPSAFNLRSLSYNRTAFDAAGIETPNVSWTPQDFLAAAQALTTGEGDQKQYGYVALSGVQTDLLFFIGQFGGRLTSGSGQDLRPTLTDPKTVEAIKWYLDLSKTHGVQPPVQIYYKRDDPGFEDKSFEYVRMGRAGMWFDTGYGMFSQEGGIADTRMGGPGIDPSQPAPSFEVGVSPLPVGSGGLRSGDFYARGMHISAGTENAQACWEWLKFLSSDVSTIYGDYPARISVAQGEAFTSQASPERLEIYEANAELLKRPGQPGDDPYVLYGGQLDSYWFFKAIMEHVKDDADLDAGLAEAQRLTTAFTECVAEGERPAVCAPKVDPDYQGFNFEDPSISMPKG
jgi:multiple sugar transport system substrate-binding protein